MASARRRLENEQGYIERLLRGTSVERLSLDKLVLLLQAAERAACYAEQIGDQGEVDLWARTSSDASRGILRNGSRRNAGRPPGKRKKAAKKKAKRKVKGSQAVNQLVRDQFRDIYDS